MANTVYMLRAGIAALFSVFLFTTCSDTSVETVYIGTASNMFPAMQELASAFEEQSGVNVEIVSGSSGKLSAQIEQGHPIDVFVSADMQYPMHLYRSAHADEKPKIYAYGELVIIAVPGVEPAFETMLTEAVHQIALANPRSAPYGIAAMTALRNAGVADSIQHKLVYGQSISHATHFVDARAADIGVTAKSLVAAPGAQNRNWAPVPESLYTPLAQGVLLVSHDDKDDENARAFFDFMTSDAARSILEQHGYALPPLR